MELIGLLELLNFCGCFLELLALTSSGTATYSGVQMVRQRKKNAPAEDPTRFSRVLRFIVLLTIAIGFIVLVVLKWAVAF
jgi:hypothetical protein